MPEDRAASFLQMIRRSQRGRLKVYLGYGPGVGKTFQMLQEAHRLKKEGIDVDAIIARRPLVAVIDELAHTNVPGSRNAKRYQDVQDVLAAGIHVISAMNVQHL